VDISLKFYLEVVEKPLYILPFGPKRITGINGRLNHFFLGSSVGVLM